MNWSAESNLEYRDRMDMPVECLAVAMWGVTDGPDKKFLDHEIVEEATRKIELLKHMLLATGMNPKLLQAVLNG